MNENSGRLRNLDKMAGAICEARERNLLRTDHYLHLRCEVSHHAMLELFEEYQDDENVRLVSLMDHTPGQRQFTRMDKYAEYYQGKYGMTDAELERFIEEKRINQQRYSALEPSGGRRPMPRPGHSDG